MTDDELKQKQIELETLQNEIKKELKSRTIDKRNRKRVIFNYDTDNQLELLNLFKTIYTIAIKEKCVVNTIKLLDKYLTTMKQKYQTS